ncbi:hypothetical protein K493DRAFT_318766 [Basidiobolus meristosporus CBS 931.73]|uniref:Uncharacterized protein n=1 Tax=Basidiobolus meristosporus CBS 931.73 TaxID=1314790 RepID=A0A1Y1XUB5_9FUNG|nr:hypothetical protein K493DRAFT_318766 [Basidiobolus meristosporus CBS 931.73]|eukprot:ORX89352.1 hypothetical protein K493DRAFT_318766 [Basidiobolus meristosporus CBS 931.73]
MSATIIRTTSISARVINSASPLSLAALGVFGVGWLGSTLLTQKAKGPEICSFKGSMAKDLGTFVWW